MIRRESISGQNGKQTAFIEASATLQRGGVVGLQASMGDPDRHGAVGRV